MCEWVCMYYHSGRLYDNVDPSGHPSSVPGRELMELY